MTKTRRRGIQSDWVIALNQSRSAKTSRSSLPLPSPVTSNIRADTTREKSNSHSDHDRDAPEASGRCNPPVDPPPQDNNYLNDPVQSPSRSFRTNDNPALEHPSQLDNVTSDDSERAEEEEDSEFQRFHNEDCEPEPGEPSLVATNQRRTTEAHVLQSSAPCAGRENIQVSLNPLSHPPPAIDYRSREADIDTLQDRRAKWENHLSLSAVVSVVGSVRYTVDQYDYTRNILREEVPGSGDIWPPYSRTQRYFREILTFSLPEGQLARLPKKNAIQLENPARYDPQDTEEVRIFLPSAWAKLDIATSTTFNEMFPTNSGNDLNRNSLGRSRIIRDRTSITSSCDYIFIDHGEHSMPCGPGSVLEVSVRSQTPQFHTPHVFLSCEGEYSFKACIAATWCAGANSSPNPSFERAMNLDTLSTSQKMLIKALSTGPSRPEDPELNHLGVLPGDICTLLSSEGSNEENVYFAVIIHRFWRFEDGIPSILILWVRVSTTDAEISPDANEPCEFAECHAVNTVSLSRPCRTCVTERRGEERGCLADGTPFVVYRILPYCDDFRNSSQIGKSGSAGGCYFLPLSLPPERRRNASSLRIISLTPPGVSTNQVLHFIVDDLVNATVCGVDGTTPTGEPLKIFFDVVGYVGDYPAAASSVDLIGHVGSTPCTLCSFRRLQARQAEGSRYGYTTSVHAGNSTFLRHAERHLSLRRSGISDGDTNILGMVDSDKADERSCPLLHLYNTLESKRSHIPLTTFGTPVVQGEFDPYRSNVVAPDHLLAGLAQDILNTAFECLPTEEMRITFDIRICAALRQNGLLPQKEVFHMKNRKLHSMTLSELFGVLLGAVPVSRIITSHFPQTDIVIEAVALLTKLQRLVAFTYCWRQRDLDGEAADLFASRPSDTYFSELKRQSKAYVKAVDRFCKIATGIKAHVDKPNLHRLIKLYEHTIPAFGHVREFMELVFETAHQPLKRCIQRSNNKKAHIFAAEHCVGNDWQGRLSALSRETSHENPLRRLTARRGLRRLLLGAEADMLNETQDKDFIVETDSMLQKLFTRALRIQFGKDNMISNFAAAKQTIWKPKTKITLQNLSMSVAISRNVLEAVIRSAKRWLNALYPPTIRDKEGPLSIELYQFAKRIKVTDTGRQIGSASRFDVLSSNCVLKAYTTSARRTDKILQSVAGPCAIPIFFIIVAVLHREGDLVWGICSRCSLTEDTIQIVGKLDPGTFQLLCLTPQIRRVAIYHICEDNERSNRCEVDLKNKDIHHTLSPLQGASMYFQTREEGYPPRQA